MSKRKAVVNEIIYELDIDDVDTSSEDERNESKKIRAAQEESPILVNDSLNETTELEVVDVDSSDDAISILSPAATAQNGGKSPELNKSDTVVSSQDEDNADTVRIIDVVNDPVLNEENIDGASVSSLNEDIIVDSPGSNPIVVGCENRKPLVTVMFKNSRLANEYKKKIKEFMLKLIKLHEEDTTIDFDNETDLELDIWPEDLIEEEKPEDDDAGLFFVDTEPVTYNSIEIPQYSQNSTILLNEITEEPSTPTPTRRGPTCFNCDGAHPLKDCTLPRNNARIMENRKAMNATRVGRYHVEDEQKYGHLAPGRISGKLRHAMGLRRDELPPYIYRMRVLGYPPGWLEEARISHSGITMFDYSGKAIQDPEEEEGELCQPGSKDKFDIKKILDFPGFNMPPSSRYKEEGYKYHVPPLSDQDSKLNMLQVLAPNAMKAYKRKKLAFFPTASSNNLVLDGQAEMELDSGDESPIFPSVPPLPDEAPPPPPPPPTAPPPATEPPLPTSSPSPPTAQPPLPTFPPPPPTDLPPLPASPTLAPPTSPPKVAPSTMQSADNDKTQNDDEGISSEGETTQSFAGRESPTLTDLEEKKRLLLAALEESPRTSPAALTKSDSDTTIQQETTDTKIISEPIKPKMKETSLPPSLEQNTPEPSIVSSEVADQEPSSSTSPATPKAGHVKMTSYGTPVLNVASPFNKLPTDDKFAKDICDVINFENLPDSTGKYVKISNLLKRVKSEVDRIQES